MNVSFIATMFALGLATSIHCVFMCGGLVMTYAVMGAKDGPWYRKLVPHLVYQGAKITSYAIVALIIGGIVALLGRTFDSAPIRNWVQVIAGVYMVLLGLSMTGKFQVLRYLQPRPPKFLVTALSRNRAKAKEEAAEHHASLATPLTFGLLTGLMPCAPLIAAQMSAASTGSPLTGAAGMIAFGLGTAPLMLAFGFASSLLSRRFQAKFQIVAAIAVIIFGLVIFNRGLMLVGSPISFDSVRTAITSPAGSGTTSSDTAFTKAADGVVEIPLVIKNTQFVPQTVNIPADTPVRLVVDRQEANSCSDQLSIPQANVLANLAPNAVTKVDVPALPAGTYTLTCGMGMMSGSIVSGGAAGAAAPAGPSPLLPALVVGLIGVGYGTYLYRTRKKSAPAAKPGAKSSGGGKSPSGGTSAGKGGPSAVQKAESAEERSLFLGFKPAELAIGGIVIAIALVIGVLAAGLIR